MSKKRVSGAWVDDIPHIYNTSTDTFSTLPHEVIGDGTAISSYTIKGNMSQSGTPTPSNPIYPTECGDKTANLCNESTIQNGYYGSTGSLSTFTSDDRYRAFSMAIKAGTYTIKIQADEGIRLLRIATANEFYNVQEDNKAYTFTISADATMYVSWRNLSTTSSFTNMTVMLNTGQTSLPYQPFGYQIPISFGGVTYPIYLSEPIRKIADSVDTAPSTGTASRIIKKLAFDGTENVSYNARNDERQIWVVTIPTSGGTTTPDNVLSTHFVTVDSTTKPLAQGGICMRSTGNDVVIGGSYSDIGITSPSTSTIITDAVKQFLADQYAAGTPVTVWYVFATAKTESFTAPTIPTSGTAQSFDVDTTPKPSEVSLTWHGWHEHSDTKFTTP